MSPKGRGIRCDMGDKGPHLPRYGNDIRADHSDVKSNKTQPSYRTRRGVRTLTSIAICFFLIVYIMPKWLGVSLSSHINNLDRLATNIETNSTLVPLEAHVMSKCPDARDCLVDLVVPAMEQIVDKVDFTLSYIGDVAADDTVQCKHGGTECLGNMLGLCAAQLFPNDVKRSLGFSTCMIMSYEEIPSRTLVQRCSLEHGISFDDLNACISEEGKGLDLLEASVIRSQRAGVRKSCTVRLADNIWCIRDGAEWKDCPEGHDVKDLVHAVESRYHNLTSS